MQEEKEAHDLPILVHKDNYSEVQKKVQKLKENLCKFADEFDKYLGNIDDNTLINNSAQAIYKKIRNDFIGEIAKIGENDDFIIFIGYEDREKDYFDRHASEISKYKSKYKKLLRDFDQSKDLIDFLIPLLEFVIGAVQ